jgi:hypothetical protein
VTTGTSPPLLVPLALVVGVLSVLLVLVSVCVVLVFVSFAMVIPLQFFNDVV